MSLFAAAAFPLSDTGSDAFVRKAGRILITTIAGALRAIRLYPPENEAVKNALDDVVTAARELTRREKELELRASVEFIFVNATRLRLDLDNYASFSQLLSLLQACGIGTRARGGACGGARLACLSLAAARAGTRQRNHARCGAPQAGSGRRSFDRSRSTARHGRRSRLSRARQGRGQAHVLAVRRGDERRDQIGAHGTEPQHQEDQTRRPIHRRPDPERRDLAVGPNDYPRLRRVHVHT